MGSIGTRFWVFFIAHTDRRTAEEILFLWCFLLLSSVVCSTKHGRAPTYIQKRIPADFNNNCTVPLFIVVLCCSIAAKVRNLHPFTLPVIACWHIFVCECLCCNCRHAGVYIDQSNPEIPLRVRQSFYVAHPLAHEVLCASTQLWFDVPKLYTKPYYVQDLLKLKHSTSS